MQADNIHAQIEKLLRRKKNIYTVHEFPALAAQTSKGYNDTIVMKPSNFTNFTSAKKTEPRKSKKAEPMVRLPVYTDRPQIGVPASASRRGGVKKTAGRLLTKSGENQKLANHIPLIATLRVVQFRRNDLNFYYKTAHDQTTFKRCAFLKTGFEPIKPDSRTAPRGINCEKKNKLVNTLLPLLSQQYHKYYLDMPENETSEDLLKRTDPNQ